MTAPIASIDFETRSTVDLRKAGADRYAEDHNTGVWCLAYAIDDGPVKVWEPGDEDPQDLLSHITAGHAVGAWNVAFEHAIWTHVIARICPHWPQLKLAQLDCTMARAYAQALPGSLEWCAKALRLEHEKDKEGHALMMRMSAPTLAWKRNPVGPPQWYDDRERVERLKVYCAQDVVVERELRKRLAPLPAHERQIWLLDQAVNRRGVQLDIPSVEAALSLVKSETADLHRQMATATKGGVSTASAVAKLTEWVKWRGVPCSDLQKHSVRDLLAGKLPDDVRIALEIRQAAGRVSTSKLPAMLTCASSDGRARGLFGYHVATTGRWASFRLQVHNMLRAFLTPDQIDHVIELLFHPHPSREIHALYGNPLDAIASCIRSMIIAAPGHRLDGGDFSNIEGRVLAWLAGEQWKLNAFSAYDAGHGPDLYNLAYARSFGIKADDVTPDQRQIGKVQELALGYQGGPGAFMSMAANYNLDIADLCQATIGAADDWDGFIHSQLIHPRTPQMYGMVRDSLDFEQWLALRYIVTRWRDAHPNIRQFWYDLQNNALLAVQNPREQFATETGSITFLFNGNRLFCRLPNGRCLSYPFAKIVYEKDEVTNETKPGLQYECWDGILKKWTTARAYGGHLAENVTQAVARDILADTLLRVEKAGYPIVLHVHDEVLCEVKEGAPADLEQLMRVTEPWAAGLPIAAKTWTGKRYGK